MKKLLLIIIALIAYNAGAQTGGVKIGDDPQTQDGSAVLELASTTKGFLPPRMTSVQMNAIPSPSQGLIVFCTDCPTLGLYNYNGTVWKSVTGELPPVLLSGCPGFSGAFAESVQLIGATYKVTVTNSSLTPTSGIISLSPSDLVLTGMAGLTVGTPSPSSIPVLQAGDVSTIEYPINGMPVTTGTLNGSWSKVGLTCNTDKPVGTLSTLLTTDCATTAALNGNYINGFVMDPGTNKFTITIANNTGFTLNNLTAPAIGNLVLSGVGAAGLAVASVSPNTAFNIANGSSQTITYVLSGTPTTNGTLTASWSYNGLTCTKNKTINAISDVLTTDCATTAAINGNYVNGFAMAPLTNTFTITVANNTGFAINNLMAPAIGNLTLSGLGAAGLGVASVSPNTAFNLANGATQTITYGLNGTPTTNGTLTANWSYNGFTCAKNKTVAGISGSLASDYCTGALLNGVYLSGTAFTGANTFTVTITNNSGAAINGLPAPTIGSLATTWTGTGTLTVASVTPAAAFNLANGGTQTFTYTLSGTPTSSGFLTATWTYSDLTCQKIATIPGSATFSLPMNKFVVSTTSYNGFIDNGANKMTINVPYTAGSGIYAGYEGTFVLGALGEVNDSNSFRISYPAGTFTTTGFIPVTIVVDGDASYSVKTQAIGVQQNVVTLPMIVGGINKGNLVINAVGGILDRRFGQTSTVNGVAGRYHDNVYVPITVGGKKWLMHNLGSDYNNVNSPSCNPLQAPTSTSDFHAYGSMFQWGRYSDGHELMNWTSATTGTPVDLNVSTTTTSSNTPPSSLYITSNSGFYDWRDPQNGNLWEVVNGDANNPCPVGYRITQYVDYAVSSASSTTNSATAFTILKLVRGGHRDSNGNVSVSANSVAWTDNDSAPLATFYYYTSTTKSSDNDRRAAAWPVRCIEN